LSRLRVGVLFGGRSGEHEVSLRSARSVMEHLDPGKYEIVPIGITPTGQWFSGDQTLERFELHTTKGRQRVMLIPEPGSRTLFAWGPDRPPQGLADLDVLFPVIHGTFGEDGTLQGLLELAELPYVSCGVLASSVGMDKGVFKDVMRMHGIPVVESVVLLASEISGKPDQALDMAEGVSPYPLFTKPANLGSSVGISKCNNRSDLLEGLIDAARYDRRILVERGLDAREVEVSVLGNDDPHASVPGEVIPGDVFYSYRAKYLDDSARLLIPAPLTTKQTARVQDLAISAFRVIDGAGMARADFLLERSSGEFYLNELNTLPGFTSISMYPKLWGASGLPYPALLDRLIELGLERHAERTRLVRTYEA
jgi:D-alanine-D-alanine ligase